MGSSKFNASLPNLELILHELERVNDLKEVELGIKVLMHIRQKEE